MKFKIIDFDYSILSTDKFLIWSNAKSPKTHLRLKSKLDFSDSKEFLIEPKSYIKAVIGNKLILGRNQPEGILTLNLDSFVIEDIQTTEIPFYQWKTGLFLFFDYSIRKYIIKKGDKTLHQIEKPNGKGTFKPIDAGMFHYESSPTESWIQLNDHKTGKELWKINFDWSITPIAFYQNFIALWYFIEDARKDKNYTGQMEYMETEDYTIVIDATTGQEIWRKKFRFSHVDIERGVILTGGGVIGDPSLPLIEVDIKTGKVLAEVNPWPNNTNYGYVPHLVDDEGFYCDSAEGSFCKISKNDGRVIWEFELLDDKGAKRKINDWLLLGNGNLVLKPNPNHVNGDFACIFNPNQNLEFATKLEGKLIREPSVDVRGGRVGLR